MSKMEKDKVKPNEQEESILQDLTDRKFNYIEDGEVVIFPPRKKKEGK